MELVIIDLSEQLDSKDSLIEKIKSARLVGCDICGVLHRPQEDCAPLLREHVGDLLCFFPYLSHILLATDQVTCYAFNYFDDPKEVGASPYPYVKPIPGLIYEAIELFIEDNGGFPANITIVGATEEDVSWANEADMVFLDSREPPGTSTFLTVSNWLDS